MIALLLAVAIPSINIIDDAGRARSTEQWRGTPTILVPMYTRCPLACPMIADNLKRASANININTYRVVFFSFDPRDTPADLREFREHHHIPLAWTLATANAADTRRLMDAIDFRFSEVMTHPSQVVVLTPKLERAKVLLGTTFDAATLNAALDVARGGRDWLGRYGGYALALLLLVCVLSVIYLATLLRHSSNRRSRTLNISS